MATYTRELAADAINPTTVDNETKAEAGAEPPMVQVRHDYDPFGAAIGNWTQLTGTQIWAAWPGIAGSSYSEAGGVQTCNDGGNVAYAIGHRRDITYRDMDIWCHYSVTDSLSWAAGNAAEYFMAWRRQDDFVLLGYNCIQSGVGLTITAYKIIAGAATLLGSVVVGVNAQCWMRITRVDLTNTFTFKYATADPFVGAWNVIFSGVINEANLNGQDLYPMLGVYNNDSAAHWSFDPECTIFDQISGAEERYNPDNPEVDIVDSVNVGVGESYAFNAGLGRKWKLSGITIVQDNDGGSNLWKVGYSDNPDGTAVTWDAGWRTPAQLQTNAAAGNYNNHQYLYAKWQGNSDSTQLPNADSFSITGSASNRGAKHRNQMRRIKYGMSRIEP